MEWTEKTPTRSAAASENIEKDKGEVGGALERGPQPQGNPLRSGLISCIGPGFAVSGADPIAERPGFKAMLERIASNGVRCILVESPDRFARDLTVQLTGHDFLKSLGVSLIPATAPDFFTEDTPTAVLVRQVLGAIAQFEKTSLVAKLRAARDRKIAAGEKCGGRKSYAEARPEVVALPRAERSTHVVAQDISRARPPRLPHRQRSAVRCHGCAVDASVA